MKRLSFIFRLSNVLILLGVSASCFFVSWISFAETYEETLLPAPVNEIIPDPIPNYDYADEIERLIFQENRLGEAYHLCRFVAETKGMPGHEEAKELLPLIEQRRNSIGRKAEDYWDGFVLGETQSGANLLGTLSADLMFWGDLRDLAKEGFHKLVDEDVDHFIVVCSSIGLMTELVDFLDIAPAILKTMYKAKSLTAELTDFFLGQFKTVLKTGKVAPNLKTAVLDLGKLHRKLGIERMTTVFKSIDDPSALRTVTKVADTHPDTAYLALLHGGPEGVEMLKRFGNTPEGLTFLTKGTMKGPEMLRWLKRGGDGRKFVVGTKIIARTAKNLRFGRLQRAVCEVLQRIPKIRWVLVTIGALSLIGATVLSIRYLMPKQSRKQSAKEPKQTNV